MPTSSSIILREEFDVDTNNSSNFHLKKAFRSIETSKSLKLAFGFVLGHDYRKETSSFGKGEGNFHIFREISMEVSISCQKFKQYNGNLSVQR